MVEDENCRLTNTRYADDILLYGKSLKELVRMTNLLTTELHSIGLRLNPEKTKILHTSNDDDVMTQHDYVEINDGIIQILHPSQHHRYLGRMFSLSPDLRDRTSLSQAASLGIFS